jgi:hypothetical protein
MAIDSNGNTYENRTLQFRGLAYGDSTVSLTATINGDTVFSGEVPTINSSLPMPPVDDTDAGLLFSLIDSQLFRSNQPGSYAVSITVSGGYGAIVTGIYNNYVKHAILTDQPVAVLANSSIEGTTLTIGSIISGSVAIGQLVCLSNQYEPLAEITAGSGLTWTVRTSQTVSDKEMLSYGVDMTHGTATDFREVYHGLGISDVVIDGVAQTIIPPVTRWGPIIVPSGRTLAYNLKVGY